MTDLRVFVLVNDCREEDLLRRLLQKKFILDFTDSLQELENMLCLRHCDALLITQSGNLSKQFYLLRSRYAGLIISLIAERDLRQWRLQVRDTNTVLLIRPVRSELLLQQLEQYFVTIRKINKELLDDNKLNSFLSQSPSLILSNLERRCLQFLLNTQSSKVHKLSLQTHLFGESGYLCDARLNACWHRLRKKINSHAPQVVLKREYNGFLEISHLRS